MSLSLIIADAGIIPQASSGVLYASPGEHSV